MRRSGRVGAPQRAVGAELQPFDEMKRTKWIMLAVVGLITVAVGGWVAAGALQQQSAQDTQQASTEAVQASDLQPISFPHDLHAGKNAIPCMYCHYTADRSDDAGIPAVQICAGCHIPGGVPMVRADRPEVKKLIEYYNEQKPIPWNRIHKIADHAHFPHMMHINAGLDCQTCHGQVQEMGPPQVEKVAPLTMGWCINCHEQRKVRTDCTVCHY